MDSSMSDVTAGNGAAVLTNDGPSTTPGAGGTTLLKVDGLKKYLSLIHI